MHAHTVTATRIILALVLAGDRDRREAVQTGEQVGVERVGRAGRQQAGQDDPGGEPAC